MPRGQTHELWGVFFLPPLAYIYYKFTGDIKTSVLFGIAFLFGNFMLSPDLDTRSRSYTRWGILRFIWVPYQKIMKHRSFLSHFPVISSIIRAVYLISAFVVLISITTYVLFLAISWLGVEGNSKDFFDILRGSFHGTTKILLDIEREYMLAIFLGVSAGDTIHYLLDVITTGLKSVMR